MAFDHGILNLPLHKRGAGTIDAQIDRYKADLARSERAAAKAATKARKAEKMQAKDLFAEFGADMISEYGDRFGKKEVAKLFDSWIKWESTKFVDFCAVYLKQKGLYP
jgi:hypothetical protein